MARPKPPWDPSSEKVMDELRLATARLRLLERFLVLDQPADRNFVKLRVPLDAVKHAEVEGSDGLWAVLIRFDLTQAVTDGRFHPRFRNFPRSSLTLRLPVRLVQVGEADRFLNLMINYITSHGPFMSGTPEPVDSAPLIVDRYAWPPLGENGIQPDREHLTTGGVPGDVVPALSTEPVITSSDAAASPSAEPEVRPKAELWRPVVRIKHVQDSEGMTVFADLPHLDEFIEQAVNRPSE